MNDYNTIYDAPSLLLTQQNSGRTNNHNNEFIEPPSEFNKYNQIYNENTKTFDRRSILSRLSDDSKMTSCTKRKPHPAIKIANYIVNNKFNEEKTYVSKNTSLSAFKPLNGNKAISIKAKNFINFAEQYKSDTTVLRPVPKRIDVNYICFKFILNY